MGGEGEGEGEREKLTGEGDGRREEDRVEKNEKQVSLDGLAHGKMALVPCQAGRRQVGESSRRQTLASISG